MVDEAAKASSGNSTQWPVSAAPAVASAPAAAAAAAAAAEMNAQTDSDPATSALAPAPDDTTSAGGSHIHPQPPNPATSQSRHSSTALSGPASSSSSPPPAVASASASAIPPVPPRPSRQPSYTAENLGSQPMVVSSSTSSNNSTKETAAVSGTASPYGTRSRNRTAGSRPNYAEDKEAEMDYDYNAQANGDAPRSRGAPAGDATPATQPPVERSTTGISTRRSSAAFSHGVIPTANSQHSSSKDYIPGTSTFSAHPAGITITPASNKKRKAAPPTSNDSKNPSRQASPVMTRRTSTALAASNVPRLSNMLSFDNCQGYLKHGKLRADDGTVLAVDDHVYLVSEPPGEPYYLARVMEFLHANNEPNGPIDAIKVNWYYRPKDIQRKVLDTRLLYATMHSDTSPLTSLRGKCQILHRSQIDDIDEYRKSKDCFWYDKMFDRYIHRFYDLIPTSQVINVPVQVKRVLDERWRFIIVEMGRGKDLTSAVKSCKRCSSYCANNNSVECAVCRMTYHMNCVRPPLLKKPSRGFAWACGPCSRAQERKLEARNTPIVGKGTGDADEEEVLDEDEEEIPGGTGKSSEQSPSPDTEEVVVHPATAEQIAHAKLWPYRYLGIHCRVEDALDYDDRIYPRASSRLGPRHQANVNVWHGHPVEYVKPAEIKRRYAKNSHKKDAKLSHETIAALEADKAAREKRPKWVLDEPAGYEHRGEDKAWNDPENTARLIFSLPKIEELPESIPERGTDEPDAANLPSKPEDREKLIDDYMTRAKDLAESIGVSKHSTNFLDKSLEVLYKHNFDIEESLEAVKKFRKRSDLKEPVFSKEEKKKFEEGIAKFGSELQTVTRYIKTQKYGDVVRYYYMWKKTPKGRQIWGSYEGRKSKKDVKRSDVGSGKLLDDVADDFDDSAFDNDKAAERKRAFACKFCATRKSKQWRRAPSNLGGTMLSAENLPKGNGKDKSGDIILALCRRCAELWRRYGIQWEDIDEVAKKVASGGGKAWKRRIDEEMLKELVYANDIVQSPPTPPPAVLAPVTVSAPSAGNSSQEPPKKRQRLADRDLALQNGTAAAAPAEVRSHKKKIVAEKPEPPPVPELPKLRNLPCMICHVVQPLAGQLLSCRECRMSVHRNCYGVVGEVRDTSRWACDMCTNEKNPQVSTSYECVLCPIRYTEQDFIGPAKVSHKKKTDKDREKDRADRDAMFTAAWLARKKQEEMKRPANPREPLKRTAGNNWVHVTCAVWTSETKFGSAAALEPSEGIGTIPAARYEMVCKICNGKDGACVNCHQCHAAFHVECAYQAGYKVGFDITPVKSSRRDLVNTVSLGNESGSMTAAIWCKEHEVKTIIHPMHEAVSSGSGLNALQLYVQNYKQADLTLTGTVRKANLVNMATKAINQAPVAPNRRTSTTNTANSAAPPATPQSATRGSTSMDMLDQVNAPQSNAETSAEAAKKCSTCGIDVSPKWWPVLRNVPASSTYGPGHLHSRPNPQLGSPSMDHRAPNGVNGNSRNGAPLESASAVASAALTVDTNGSTASPGTTYQCHKCHVKRALPTSPPPRFTQEPPQPLHPVQSAPQVAPQLQSPPHMVVATNGQPVPASSHHHGWPHRSPPTHHVQLGPHPLSLSDSHLHTNGVPPQFSHHVSPPQSNGMAPVSHLSGYPSHLPHRGIPQSPSHGPIVSSLHSPNGVVSSYPHDGMQSLNSSQGARYVPGSLTHTSPSTMNQGLPVHGTIHPGQPMSGPHGSDRPATPRDPYPGSRPNGTYPGNDGRTGGGASLSPSLRNLLS